SRGCLEDYARRETGNFAFRGVSTIVMLAVGLICFLLVGVGAQAQIVYKENNYKQLLDADSPDTIPPGIKITVQHWEQFKKFIPVGLQAAFGGNYSIHVGSTPEYAIEVGPKHDFPLPGDMATNGEKYGGQTKLEQLPNGGWVMAGYVGGVPFPNPQERNRAVKILYNAWVPFRPHILHNLNVGFLVDRFGNKTSNNVD